MENDEEGEEEDDAEKEDSETGMGVTRVEPGA